MQFLYLVTPFLLLLAHNDHAMKNGAGTYVFIDIYPYINTFNERHGVV